MYIGFDIQSHNYFRTSSKGIVHSYIRKKTIIFLRCDACGRDFCRDRGSMDHKRLNNNVYHVCSLCDAKKFAQEKGVEGRLIWNIPASSLKTVDQF